MRSWLDLRDRFRGRDVLVIGNGPSRKGCNGLIHVAAAHGAALIGCNAIFREWLPQMDLLVAYDGIQAEAALLDAWPVEVLVPEQVGDHVRIDAELATACGDRLFEAAPHRGTARAEDFAAWDGTAALGNLSGLLAYQAALLAGARRVFLLGMDCGGSLVSGEVALTAIPRGVRGYPDDRLAPSTCEFVGETPVPRSWLDTRSYWRALTRSAERHRVETFRAVPGGALDWLEVFDPWQQDSPIAAPSSSSSSRSPTSGATTTAPPRR